MYDKSTHSQECHVIDAETGEPLHTETVALPTGVDNADETDRALDSLVSKNTDIWARNVALRFPRRPWLNVG